MPIEALLGGAAVAVGPLLCFAGENDGGGDQAASCQSLVAGAAGPAEAVIVPGSSAHGVELVQMFPDTVSATLTFLDENL